jgi:hypothetical protein
MNVSILSVAKYKVFEYETTGWWIRHHDLNGVKNTYVIGKTLKIILVTILFL